MTNYVLNTFRIDEITDSSEISVIDFAKTPQKIVQAKNLQELQPQFDAFVAEVEAGHPDTCYRIYVSKHPRCSGRKFPKFDKLSSPGGTLRAYVNRHVAIAAGRAKAA